MVILVAVIASALGVVGRPGAALNNDLIGNAVVILGSPVTYMFDTSTYNASSDETDPDVECGPSAPGFKQQSHTAWFTFVPITSGEFRASTEGTTEIATVLALWSASSEGQLVALIACNTVSQAGGQPPPLHSEIPPNPAYPGPMLTAGQRYYLEVMSPQGAPGGEIELSVSYTGLLSPRPVPVLAAMDPAGAPVGAGPLEIAITGSGLSEATRVQFGTQVLVPSAASPGSLTVTVPAALLEDEAHIAVTLSNPEPGGGTSEAKTFVVYPVPQVVAIEPTSVVAGTNGVTLNIVGSGLRAGISEAMAGGVPRAISVIGPTTAKITLLEADVAAPGLLAIAVTNASGNGAPIASEPVMLLVRDSLDADCSGSIGGEDALHLLRLQAGLAQALPGCPIAIETGVMLRSVLDIRRIAAGLGPRPPQ